MYFSIFKNISVHCWGGLGSQLFAYSTAEYILQKYPKKRIRIVLHTSGVTKRAPAIDFLKSRFELVNKDDFDEKLIRNLKFSHSRSLSRRVTKYLLGITYLILDGNDTANLKKIKPWTLVLRGHYSHAEISESTLKTMLRVIEDFTKPNLDENYLQNNQLGLHYRLGDLVKLDKKSHMNPQLISAFVSQIAEKNKITEIHVYSDDLALSKSLLSITLDNVVFKKQPDVLISIMQLMRYNYFIGSNSKISVWVVLFRLFDNPNSWNAIPVSIKKNLENIWPQALTAKNIFYY